MQTIRLTRLLTVGMLAMPIAGRAQAPKPISRPKPAQSGIDGKWYPDGSLSGTPSTLLFKTSGTKLTGSVSRDTSTMAIYEGKIVGNTISFKFKSPAGGRTISLVGKVTASRIAFTREVKIDSGGNAGGAGIFGALGSSTFTAVRTAPDPDPRAQGPQPTIKGPQPKITEIAAIPGVEFQEAVRMPNHHVVIFDSAGSILAHDLTTKHSTLITHVPGPDITWDLNVAPQGNRITYSLEDKDGNDFVWAVAVDPATGAPTGPAQRVSLSSGFGPVLSPDGKFIAFVKNPTDTTRPASQRADELAIIPATGGSERVLADFPKGFFKVVWSLDGKWIYVQDGGRFARNRNTDPDRSIWRVPVTGGPKEFVVAYAEPAKAKSAIDPRIAFFDLAWGNSRIGYITADGNRGAYDVPYTTQRGWTFGPRETLTKNTRPSILNVLDIGTGQVRKLPFEGAMPRNVVWSPDKKHLALVGGEQDRAELVVMNADGTGQRRFPFRGGATAFNGTPAWSPDGTNLEFISDSGRDVHVLNVATGVSRIIASVAAPVRFTNNVRWQANGKSLLTMTAHVSDSGYRSRYAVVEIKLDGTRRVVRDLSTEFPAAREQAFLVSSRQAVMETVDAGGAHVSPWLFLVSLDGGATRTLTTPVLEPGTHMGFVVGHSDRWLVSVLFSAKNEMIGTIVMSTGTDSTRVLHFPPNLYTAGLNLVFPDGERLMRIGPTAGSEDLSVSSIPVNGGAARVIGHIPWMPGWNGFGSGLSDDGTSFAFFAQGTPTTHILDVDLTQIFQLINKKP